MSKYRKKPVVVEAIQWTGENLLEICNFTGKCGGELIKNGEMYIDTLEGVHHASVGDFIIKGVHSEFYPCKPDIFGKTYNAEYPQTNADRIRAMSDEELAEFMANKCLDGETAKLAQPWGWTLTYTEREMVRHKLFMQWFGWLKQPVKDGEGE